MELFDLIRKGDLDGIKKIVASNPTIIHKADDRGFTPLVKSTYVGQIAVAQVLIDAGADVDQQDASGNTALMGVCFKGAADIAKLLIEAGADIHIKNKKGMTALDFAKQYDQAAIVELLQS